MDIGAIINATFSGVNVKDIFLGIISGALFLKLFDEILVKLVLQFFPDKAISMLLKKLEEFDDKYIDPIKEKYPKAGRSLELKIADVFDKAEKIILDK